MITKIKVAGCVIEAECLYNYFNILSQDYLTDEPADIRLRITQEDIEQQKVRFIAKHHTEVPVDKKLEVFALLRKVSEALLNYDTFLLPYY